MSVIYVSPGPVKTKLVRDDQSHREYSITRIVETDNSRDGPSTVLAAPGLPRVGSPYLVGNDVDLWAWCRFNATVTPMVEKDAWRQWEVEQVFSTKPQEPGKARCIDSKWENPLSEPPKISGSAHKFTREAMVDVYGRPILSSCWEMLRGKENEWDEAYPTVKIEQNLATFYQAFTLPNAMMNTLNGVPLWGLPPRTVKLANFNWDRQYYGTCFPYYKRVLEFEVNYETWDRSLLDVGSSVLRGHTEPRPAGGTYWVLDKVNGVSPDPANSADFIEYKDSRGGSHNQGVVLNGAGLPAGAWIKGFGAPYSGYVCIAGPGSSGALNKKLTDRRYWILQNDNSVNFQEQAWAPDIEYRTGDIVFTTNNNYWIALLPNQFHNPEIDEAFGRFTVWRFVGGGSATSSPINDVGVYDRTRTYFYGERVQAAPTVAGQHDFLLTPGYRFIQKYLSANHLLLGIPVVF